MKNGNSKNKAVGIKSPGTTFNFYDEDTFQEVIVCLQYERIKYQQSYKS